MENSLNPTDALVRLEEPFASKDVKWLVAATSRDGRKGRVTPYADPRAYTDRLNHIFTASCWTREYSVHTVSPITRMKKDKPIQTGKVLVTCVVSIPGVGTHSGSGEEWADDENAMTSAEAQAFKRACSCFGLGRYFYNFAEMWVDLDEYKHPREIPALPSWALPECERRAPVQNGTARKENGNAAAAVQKGPLDASITGKIEVCRRDLGQTLYSNILGSVAKVRSARDIPNQRVQQEVLKWMESGVRGMAQTLPAPIVNVVERVVERVIYQQDSQCLLNLQEASKLISAAAARLEESPAHRQLPVHLNPLSTIETFPTLDEMERTMILAAYRKSNRRPVEAARLLGIGKTTFYRKLREMRQIAA